MSASRKVKDNISESFTELRNTSLSGLTELFPHGALEKMAEKSSQVLHDKAIRKVVMMNKGQKKPAKKLQVFHLTHGRHSFKHSDSQLSRTSSGWVLPLLVLRRKAYFGETLLKVTKNFLRPKMPLSVFWRDTQRKRRKCLAT